MAFVKAVKHQAKIRLALAGPSGSGKTYTALTLATALADGKPVAVIDTERGSASKYADLFPEFDVMEMDSFHPDKFTAGIREAEQAGYAVLVIDSLSHAWNGTGGLLEIVEAVAKRSKSGSTFNAWSEATPIQNRLIDTITRSKMHIICTMRSKQEYVLESVNGKTVPRKMGMAPIQRGDLEYEFDVFGEMDYENSLIIQKSRCPALSGQVIAKPDSRVADVLKVWLEGAPAPERVAQQDAPVTEQQLSSIRKLREHLGKSEQSEALSYDSAKELIAQLTQEYRQGRANGTDVAAQPTNGQKTALQRAVDAAMQRALVGKVIANEAEFSGLLDKIGVPKPTTGQDINKLNTAISEMVAAVK